MFSSRGPILFLSNPATVAAGWNLATATSDNKTFSVSTQDGTPRGLYVKDDGTKFYIAGDANNRIYQYSMSTPFDISSGSYDNKNFSVATQDTTPRDVFFKTDGTKMYVAGGATSYIYQYSLSTAWDVSTASYDSKRKSTSGEMTTPDGLFFKPDGTKMYVSGTGIAEYALSTAWDVSTASFTIDKSTTAQDSLPTAIWWKDDGTRFFILGNFNDKVFQYNITVSNAWNVAQATYSNVSLTLPVAEAVWHGISVANNGTKLYVIGTDQDTIYQYSMTS